LHISRKVPQPRPGPGRCPQPRTPAKASPTRRPTRSNAPHPPRARSNVFSHRGPDCFAKRPRRRPASLGCNSSNLDRSSETAVRSQRPPLRAKRQAISPTINWAAEAWATYNKIRVVPSNSCGAFARRNRDTWAIADWPSAARNTLGFCNKPPATAASKKHRIVNGPSATAGSSHVSSRDRGMRVAIGPGATCYKRPASQEKKRSQTLSNALHSDGRR